MLYVALVALALGGVNLYLQRYTDGSLCIGAGIILLIIWLIQNRK